MKTLKNFVMTLLVSILSLTNLQKLRVSSYKITDAQINELQTKLPNCQIAIDEDGHDIDWELEPYWLE